MNPDYITIIVFGIIAVFVIAIIINVIKGNKEWDYQQSLKKDFDESKYKFFEYWKEKFNISFFEFLEEQKGFRSSSRTLKLKTSKGSLFLFEEYFFISIEKEHIQILELAELVTFTDDLLMAFTKLSCREEFDKMMDCCYKYEDIIEIEKRYVKTNTTTTYSQDKLGYYSSTSSYDVYDYYLHLKEKETCKLIKPEYYNKDECEIYNSLINMDIPSKK